MLLYIGVGYYLLFLYKVLTVDVRSGNSERSCVQVGPSAVIV